MSGNFALLGWGSLLWEHRDSFDKLHEAWLYDGPILKIEFSRVSSSRDGALTLVIDSKNGVPTTVSHCLSRRAKLGDVIEDLRAREGTTTSNIGYVVPGEKTRCRDRETQDQLLAWIAPRKLNGVVWTDLPSNFEQAVGEPFTVANALAYIGALDQKTKARVLEYVCSAPDFVRTPLRDALANYG